jgi:hypothetical protein
MRLRSLCFAAWAAVLLVGGSGCGGGGKPVKVSGKVTLDGEPLAGASVQFMPINEKGDLAQGGHPAFGTTDDGGKFQLTTFNTDDGALPGQYKLIVLFAETPQIDVSQEQAGQKVAPQLAAMKALMKQGKTKKKEPPKIPAKYSDPKNTPLRARVPPDGEVILPLTSK